MYKIIGADKKEYGPVSADQMHRWISEGRANSQTLVQAEGTADWKPLGQIPEFADSLRVHTESPPPLPSTAPASPEAWQSEVLTRTPQINIGSCLSRAWTLLGENFPLFFLTTLLLWIINIAGSMTLPTILICWVLRGALYGGIYLVFIKRLRGESASFGDMFSGFRQSFAQLILAGCITSFLSALGFIFCVIPGLYLAIAWLYSLPLVADRKLEFWSAMELSRKTVTRVWFAAFALVLLAFLPSLIFSAVVEMKTLYPVYSWVVDAFSHGNLTPEQIQALTPKLQAFMASNIQANMTLIWVAKFVQLLNMPFALAALMCGYENLFGSRKA